MRVLATIFVVLTSVLGFLFSYEVAYQKITRMLNNTESKPQIASTQMR